MPIDSAKTVYLSFISTDLPVWKVIEGQAALYKKEGERFHLLLDGQKLPHSVLPGKTKPDRGIFWLDISPYRVMLTMQSSSRLSYRHFWERGVYGVSRYCFNTEADEPSQSIRLRNFTRYLKVKGNAYPTSVRIEYELWSAKVQLGSYVLHLEIE